MAAAACPVCGHEHAKLMWRRGDRIFRSTDKLFSLWRCESCRTYYLDPMPEARELAGYYPDGYWVGPAGGEDSGLLAQITGFYRRLVLRDHLNFVGRAIEEQRQRGLAPRIIDIGCGDGSFLEALGAEDCIGMDFSMSALGAGRAWGLRMLQGMLLTNRQPSAPFPDGTFSLVCSFHFLEHVPDPQPILAEMRRILHPDGDLILQVPNKDSYQARILGRHWSGLDVPRHLVNYSTRTLCDLLGRCGFTVLRRSHASLRDNPTTLANSLVPCLFPPARIARGGAQHGPAAWCASLAYLGITMAALPLTVLEGALGHGAAVMVQARALP